MICKNCRRQLPFDPEINLEKYDVYFLNQNLCDENCAEEYAEWYNACRAEEKGKREQSDFDDYLYQQEKENKLT